MEKGNLLVNLAGTRPPSPRNPDPANVSLDQTGGEALNKILDSGASHVILPLETLSESDKGHKASASPVQLHLASCVNQCSWICASEVFAEKVRRVLLPLGRLVKQTGALHSIVRAKLRQGSMPHVPRSVTRVIPYSEWVHRLGDLYIGDPSSSLQIVASDSDDKSFEDDEASM
eukprot:2339779-Amphidinium_carterae.3